MRISAWSSDVCASDRPRPARPRARFRPAVAARRDGETLARRTLLARLCAHHRPAHGRLFCADPVLLLYPEMDSEDRRRYGEIVCASCRERVCTYVYIEGAAGSIQKKHTTI